MAGEVVSSMDLLSKRFPDATFWRQENARVQALKVYFSNGGIISISPNSAGKKEAWPKLLYPNSTRVEQQIADLEEKRRLFSAKKKDWGHKRMEAETQDLRHNIKKFGDALYWKHMTKMLTDKDYRADYNAVKMPTHLVSDPRYRGMVNKFVNDFEYRKQLAETVQHSIVYKKNKRVAKYASDVNEFRAGISSYKEEQASKKLEELDNQINALREILRWSKS